MSVLKAWYNTGELARMAGVSSKKMLKLVREQHRGTLHKNRGGHFVYLWDLQRGLKGLWNSILEMEALRARMGLENVVIRPEPHYIPPEDSEDEGE